MGNSGGGGYTPPPPQQMPITDSVAQNAEAQKLASQKSMQGGREANDLNETNANNQEATTRGQLAKADMMRPQPPVRGPRERKQGPRPSPASGMNKSAVVTG